MLQIFASIIGSSALSVVITNLYSEYKERKRSNKIDRMLLLDAFIRQSTNAIADGHISTTDLKRIEKYYSLYKELGGDGFADALRSKVCALQIDVES